MSPIFLDTGYVLALELANDQNHQAASKHWQQLAGAPPSMITTSYVFGEIVTFFNSRGYHRKASQLGGSLLQSAAVELIHVDESLFSQGWEYLCRHQDKRYSLTDCVSFVLMARLGIVTAFAFDQHFEQAGFKIEP